MAWSSLRSNVALGLLIGQLSFVPLGLAKSEPGPEPVMHLTLRTRVQSFKADGEWQEANLRADIPANEAAIIICDMWDNHWCRGAAKRVEVLAQKMVPVLDVAREHGIVIIHAPSETMDFYRDFPQRKRMLELPAVSPPALLNIARPPLPIDDADGGCDTTPPDTEHMAWKHENSTIIIHDSDFVSDDGNEVYNLLRQRGIKNLFVMGVHTNMCILNRTFAIRHMTERGIRCILVRDLTDSLYNSKDAPYVSHEAGTELVIEYIEQNYCPTVLGGNMVRALTDTSSAGHQK